jgi:hypothetical protein
MMIESLRCTQLFDGVSTKNVLGSCSKSNEAKKMSVWLSCRVRATNVNGYGTANAPRVLGGVRLDL